MSLYAELTTDPAALGYAPYLTARNDQKLHDMMHAVNATKLGWVTVAAFNAWCAQYNAEYVNIETIAANNANASYASAKALLRCLNGAVNDGALNLADPKITALLNAWPFVDTSGSAKSALIALGTFPASRADLLPFPCGLSDISTALNRGY